MKIAYLIKLLLFKARKKSKHKESHISKLGKVMEGFVKISAKAESRLGKKQQWNPNTIREAIWNIYKILKTLQQINKWATVNRIINYHEKPFNYDFLKTSPLWVKSRPKVRD